MQNEVIYETKESNRYAPSTAPQLEMVDTQFARKLEKIPDKMAFKIGEVADLVGVKSYVLRYWENEFEALKPRKSKNNQRVYLRKDVMMVMMIKKLLHEDRFSIEGAKTALRRLKKETKKAQEVKNLGEHIEDVADQLRGFIEELSSFKATFL